MWLLRVDGTGSLQRSGHLLFSLRALVREKDDEAATLRPLRIQCCQKNWIRAVQV